MIHRDLEIRVGEIASACYVACFAHALQSNFKYDVLCLRAAISIRVSSNFAEKVTN